MEMAVESMEMAPGAIPRPGRVPDQRLSVPRISFAMVAMLWNFSWNSDRVVRVFASEEINRRRGDARRWPRWAHHAQARPRPWIDETRAAVLPPGNSGGGRPAVAEL